FPTNISDFQAWLSEVEDSRTEGGYVGSEEGPSSEDKEYYLLCRRRVSPMLKRRRLSDSARFSEAEGSIVSCTAFVHVMERVDGSVYVRFCLEHAGHAPSDQLRQSPPVSRTRRKRRVIHCFCQAKVQRVLFFMFRSNLKRSSHSLSDSFGELAENSVTMVSNNSKVVKREYSKIVLFFKPHMPTSESAVIADGEMMCGDVIEDNNNINTIRKVCFICISSKFF
ncbi:hypothetical protein ANCCAN_30451, partial [Ancylostoma caninum]